MNDNKMAFLLCTNGTETSLVGLEYGQWLADLLKVPVTILGIVENSGRQKMVEKALSDSAARLEKGNIPYETRLLKGDLYDVMRQVVMPERHLVVFGPMGRPVWRRWLRGRSFRHVLRYIDAPLVYAPVPRSGLNQILVCMGGLGYAGSALHWAIYLAQQAGAELTILHVVEPVSYDYPAASQAQQHWMEIQETDTPQGYYLRQALEKTQRAGIGATLKIRHGSTVHEIIAEIHEGHYDLLAMGSPDSSHSLRHLFMPNVTAEVAETNSLPVLVAQSGQDSMLAELP